MNPALQGALGCEVRHRPSLRTTWLLYERRSDKSRPPHLAHRVLRGSSVVDTSTGRSANCYKNVQPSLLPLQGHLENLWGCFWLPQYWWLRLALSGWWGRKRGARLPAGHGIALHREGAPRIPRECFSSVHGYYTSRWCPHG